MIYNKYPFYILLGFTCLALSFTATKAATIKGSVLDSKSKEALVGAIVYNKVNDQINGTGGLDGGYVIKNLSKGTYTIIAKFFGYVTMEKSIVIADSTQTVTQDFLLDAESITMGQVQITATTDKGSDNYARNEEKASDNVLNIMSAKTIQLLPDLTIGDVLQRVSGVVAEKSVTGGGQYATIRGMDKQYNYTSIDGVIIPSPDYGNRYVPMNIFPAEMVERLEVIKTLTPDMEGDAIGGVMNLVLKDAPDAFLFTANIATGFNQTLLNKGFQQFDASAINANTPAQNNGPGYMAKISDFPTSNITYKDIAAPPNLTSGFTIGNRFLGGRFGILASANYQNTYNGTDGMWIKQQSQPTYSPVYNTPDWDYVSNRYYSTQQTRAAAHLKMDYIFDSKNRLDFYVMYSQMNEIRSRIEQDTDNSLKGSELDPHYQSKVTYEHILSTSLKGKDTLMHNLLLDWTGAYSRAWSNIPDWDDLGLQGTVGSDVVTFNSLSRVWMQSTDQDIAGYVNLTYDFTLFGQKVELKGGAMNRDKSRDAYYNEYDFNALPFQTPYTNASSILSNPKLDTLIDPLGQQMSGNTYSVQEDVNAFYGMLKMTLFDKVELLGGVREENTSQSYQDGESDLLPAKYAAIQYTDVLPSFEIKYMFNHKMALRASYFASISRPSFIDLVPYTQSTDEYTIYGNPHLLHTQANNYDLRFEYFPKPSEQLLVGAFYKQIYDPIEMAVLPTPSGGPSATIEQPINVGGDSVPVINYGVEVAFTKYFWRVFGISGNYTYTHSAITVSEQVIGTSTIPGKSLNQRSYTTETRPLQGQANDIANLSFIYKEPKLGLQAEVSGVYTGKSISAVSLWYGLDEWQMPMARLDFSFEKRLSKKVNLSLFGKVNNILNTPFIVRLFPPNQYANTPGTASWLPNQDSNGNLSSIVIQKEYYGQTYLMGIRYKF